MLVDDEDSIRIVVEEIIETDGYHFCYVSNGKEALELFRRQKPNLVILDVRTNNEYKSGHINGATLMPVGEISSRISELEKFRGKPILVHCASGGRSPKAVNVLLKNKFGPIYHMNHGLADFKGNMKK